MKTQLGTETEKLILAELDPIIQKFAKELKLEPEVVESSVAYLWQCRAEQSAQDWDDYLSRHEIGPYAGR
jgi:hypothetical protein